MRKLLIDGVEVNLQEDELIALTKESNNFFDLQNRRSNLTTEISIIQDEISNALFGNISDIFSADITHKKWYSATFIQAYEELITNGRGKLLRPEGNVYKLVVYWGNVDLVSELGESTIKDLDLESWNHVFNLTNVKTSGAVTGTDDAIVYPVFKSDDILKVGDVSNPIEIEKLVPFVSVAKLLEQIEIQNNISLVGSDMRKYIDVDSLESDMFIPLVNKISDAELDVEVSGLEARMVPESFIIESGFVAGNRTRTKAFPENNDPLGEHYIFGEAGSYKLSLKHTSRFRIEYDNWGNVQHLVSGEITLLLTQETIIGGVETAPTLGQVTSNPELYTFALSTKIWELNGNVNIDETKYIDIDFNLDELIDSLAFGIDDKLRYKINCFVTLNEAVIPDISIRPIADNTIFKIKPTNVQINDTISIAKNLPELKQIDLIKYIVAKEGLLLDTESSTNIFKFKKFSELAGQVTDAQDYSDKLVDFEITALHPDLARENIMRYDNKDDVLNEGEGTIVINNETLPEVAEIYKAPFSATKNIDYLTVQIAEILNNPESTDDDMNDVGFRIVKVFKRYSTLAGRLYFTDGVTDEQTTGGYKMFARFETELDFATIIIQNYQEYEEVMNKYKDISATFNMTAEDFKKIDLMLLLYVEQMGGYFIIKKVKDFVDGENTQIELLKI